MMAWETILQEWCWLSTTTSEEVQNYIHRQTQTPFVQLNPMQFLRIYYSWREFILPFFVLPKVLSQYHKQTHLLLGQF